MFRDFHGLRLWMIKFMAGKQIFEEIERLGW